MNTYRLFRLTASETAESGACWEDLGPVEIDLGDDPAGTLGERFGSGEYLFLDSSLTIADVTVA